MPQEYESQKLFYIGKEGSGKPLVYKSSDLLTHAAIIGMTGSGKTGLGITLLEEATIDNIPSIIIDPKGDMTNLMLAFEHMSADEFLPWIDASEAEGEGVSRVDLASKYAKMWRDGLVRDHQSLERVAKYKEGADFTIYTPASSAGVKVSVLSSFKAPPLEVMQDSELLTTLVGSFTGSIFALLGEKYAQSSKEAVLLNSIFMHHFSRQEDLSLDLLVREVLDPPFVRVGAFDLETFFARSDRLKFSLKLNALIANPAFSSWIDGVSLDIADLLDRSSLKAKVNIFSIAHLNDAGRMFFVTILLNEIIAWIRRQEGSSSLRALLYMDEIFGYFPPSANPPSKEPMLTLLKQARAFGVGVVLSTQNPVDIDYKGLSNIGTWFIGRLQTKQDIARVIDGLSSAGGTLDRATIADLIANLKKRHFILKSASSSELKVFETRWAMSYLRGPISQDGISSLMSKKRLTLDLGSKQSSKSSLKPIVAPMLEERYVAQDEDQFLQGYLEAEAKVRFVNKNIDTSEDVKMAYYLRDDLKGIDFSDFEEGFGRGEASFRGKNYYDLPTFVQNDRDLKALLREFSDYLYRQKRLSLYKIDALKLSSYEGESLSEFRLRVEDRLREMADESIARLRQRFERDNNALEAKLARLEERLSGAEAKASVSKTDALISIGSSLLGALFGSKVSASKVATGAKSANKLLRGSDQVKLLESDIKQLLSEQDRLRSSFEDEIAKARSESALERFSIDEMHIKPRRSDIYGVKFSLVWVGVR